MTNFATSPFRWIYHDTTRACNLVKFGGIAIFRKESMLALALYRVFVDAMEYRTVIRLVPIVDLATWYWFKWSS